LGRRLVETKQCPEEEAFEAVKRYKRFLLLVLRYPQETLAPAPDIDEAWHAHILFTRKYFRDTAAIFGGYLHHDPAGEGEGERMKEAQARAADLYELEFNEPYLLELDVSNYW